MYKQNLNKTNIGCMFNKIAQNLALKIRPFQIKIELVLISLIIIGILLKSSEIGNLLIVFSFNLLAILYFIMAFRLNVTDNKTVVFLNRQIQLSFSVGMLGILFAIQHYPDAAMMLRIAIIAMFTGLVFTIITKYKNKTSQSFIDPDTIRIVIISLAIAGIFSFGNNDLIVQPFNSERTEINSEIKNEDSNLN